MLYDHCKTGYRHNRNIYGKTEKSGDDSYKRERADTAVSGEFMGRKRRVEMTVTKGKELTQL